ncbi:MAG: hypothetical protein ABIU11_04135, partial [Chitinophagaceae bacterium]
MKQIIISIAISFSAIVATAQTYGHQKSANYEAANWTTWLLDNSQQITLSTPPSAAQSIDELQSLKQGINKLDEKKIAQIKYWDAGAPVYRWNQIAIDLLNQKFDVQLRMPASWMNI